MTDVIDPEGVLHPAQRAYALSVRAADMAYHDAVKDARKVRDAAVEEALATCMKVLEMESEKPGHVGLLAPE